jgi:DNA-binding response OmpR family regulator
MPHVLIVDDDTAIREVLYDVLSRKGFTVLTANSGLQTLEVLKTQRPEFILLDQTMPGLTGVETIKRIRLFDEAVPIILMRGAGEPDVPPADLKRLGGVEVLRKELGVELFLKNLELVIRRLQDTSRPSGAGAVVRVPGTVLLVDDEPRILNLLGEFLESRGLKVAKANSGEEAVAAMARKPMAVLLDMTMPGMDGLMTLKRIKEIHPKLPVIMVSGIGDEATVQEALDAGAYDYVTKPFNLEYLETVVLTKVLLGMEG